MKIYVQGHKKGEVTLTDKDFITEGGEGKIYGRGNTIFKIYLNKKKVIPSDKIKELSILDRPNILRPLNHILDSKKVPIGFVMKWMKNTVPVCKMFTNDFRKRMGVDPKQIAELVNNIAKDINFIHSNGCLIVDGSEMNYLVDSKDYITPYFIDVDSYQTKHFPATAITPSIKDYHTKGFGVITDWFSFAVIAIQLFIGIHPYKGKHSKYKMFELEKRMRDNISIFNSKVALPASARDFSYIPVNYKDWLFKVLEKGDRLPPPFIVGKVIVTAKIVITKSTNNFEITLIKEYDEEIVRYQEGAVFTKSKVYYQNKVYKCSSTAKLYITNRTLTPLLIDVENGDVVFKTLEGEEKTRSNISAIDTTFINDRFCIFNKASLLIDMFIEEMNNQIFPLSNKQWNVLPQATTIFDGLVYQNILGKPHLMITYQPPSGELSCMIKHFPELDGYKILEAKHDSGIAVIIGRKKNQYDEFIFKFDDIYNKYNCRIINDVNYHVPNFVTMQNGIVVKMTYDDAVEIFSKQLSKDDVKRIEDKEISFDMKLYKDGVNVVFARGKKLYKISLKKC